MQQILLHLGLALWQQQQQLLHKSARAVWEHSRPQTLVAVAEHLLRFVVASNLPVVVVENFHFRASRLQCPGYISPGNTTTRTTVLQRKNLAVMMELCTALKTTDNLKLTADCYTDMRSKPSCTFVLVLPDRSPRSLEVVDLSSERHTGELLAGAQLYARHTA
jgi:hypothetical protein